MAREDVHIKVSSDVAQAIQMWKAMEDGPQAMANQLDKLGKVGSKSARGMTADFDAMLGKIGAVTTALGLAAASVEAMTSANRKVNELTNQSNVSVDEWSRPLFVQTGVSNKREQKAFVNEILDLSYKYAVDDEIGGRAAKQLASSGFAKGEIRGGALEVALQGLLRTNAGGKDADIEGLLSAVVMDMEANKMAKTKENLFRSMSTIGGLFESTNVQLTDFQTFAPHEGVIKQLTGASGEEIKATFSQFRDAFGAEVGGTAYRAGVQRLSGAISNPKQVQALEMLGLRPEQVDLIGESMTQVRKLMSGRLAQLSPEQRNQFNSQFFDQTSLPFAGLMFDQGQIGETHRRIQAATDVRRFNEVVDIAKSGVNAEATRADVDEVRQFYNSGRKFTGGTLQKRIRNIDQKAGVSPLTQEIDQWMYWGLTGFMAEEDAAQFVAGKAVVMTDQEKNDIRERSAGRVAESKDGQPQKVDVNVNVTVQTDQGHEMPATHAVDALNSQ